MQPKFHNKNGTLTAYAFACGYIERKETENLRLDLWREGACWHVRANDFDAANCRLFWESFDLLTEARKFFNAQKRQLFKGNK